MKDVGKQGVSAAKWSAITTIARFGLQLIAQVILARLLGPENYGLFGMGLLVFTFSNFLATFGFAWSLAQLNEISDEDIRFAFTWQMIVGVTAAASLFATAPLIAEYFKEPRTEVIVKWMALICIINAAGSTSGNLMRRRMNFRSSGLIQFASYGVGYIFIGIPMAMLDYGVVALVSAWMAQAICVVVASYLAAPHPLKPLLICRQSSEMAKIGASVFFTNIGNWLINNLDRLLIGRILNAHAMGVYTVSSNLANMPNSLLLGALQPVFLAAGARVQNDPERLKRAYLDIQSTILNILLPAFVFLSLVSPLIVSVLYGKAWHEAGPAMAILFLGMPALIIWGMSTPVLWNTGRSHWEFALQLPLIPVAAAAFWFASPYGVNAAAAVASGVLFVRGAIVGVTAFKVLGLPLREVLPSFTRGAAISLLLCTIHGLLTVSLPSDTPDWIRLGISSVLSIALGLSCLLFLPRLFSTGAISLLTRFAPQIARVLNWRKGRSLR